MQKYILSYQYNGQRLNIVDCVMQVITVVIIRKATAPYYWYGSFKSRIMVSLNMKFSLDKENSINNKLRI